MLSVSPTFLIVHSYLPGDAVTVVSWVHNSLPSPKQHVEHKQIMLGIEICSSVPHLCIECM